MYVVVSWFRYTFGITPLSCGVESLGSQGGDGSVTRVFPPWLRLEYVFLSRLFDGRVYMGIFVRHLIGLCLYVLVSAVLFSVGPYFCVVKSLGPVLLGYSLL